MKKILSIFLCISLCLCFCTLPVLAADGSESSDELAFNIAIVILVPLGIALLVCMLLKAQMKTARPQSAAHDYMELDESHLHIRLDLYTHSTRVVRKIPQNNNNGR